MEQSTLRTQSAFHYVPRVQRVLQVDAERLDEEAQASVQVATTRVIDRFMRGIGFTPLTAPTVRLILQVVRHISTTVRRGTTAGLALQGLRLTDAWNSSTSPVSKGRRALLSALFVLLPLARAHLQPTRSAPLNLTWSSDWLTRTRASGRLLGIILDFASALNLLAFLRHAVYPSIAHRLAGVTLAYDARVPASRAAFHIADRQLVWQGLARLAIALRPLLPILSHVRATLLPSLSLVSTAPSTSLDGASAEMFGRTHQRCTVCHQTPVMPHQAVPCGCVSCFVCAHSRATVTCAQCGAPVTALQRMQYAS